MARAGSKKHREKKPKWLGHRPLNPDELLTRQNELVDTIWRQDKMLGIRNIILQRLQDSLTPEEKKLLASG